jgi:NADH-quinone oxidoreductase subunit D
VDGFHVWIYARERIYELFVELAGARMTTSFTRVGGIIHDLPEGWSEHALKFATR